MSADALLTKLEKSRRTGPGSWIACCPAHKDRNPSMTIRECDDGRVLLHCFAGCSVEDVLGAVGLDFDALFPPKPLGDRLPPLRKPFPAADVLEAVMHDALVLQQIAHGMEHDPQNAVNRLRIQGIVSRITAARDLVNG